MRESLVRLGICSFNTMRTGSRRIVRSIIQRAADHAVLGFLAVLDGVQAIETGPDKGKLELYYVKGESWTLLNDQRREAIHDYLKV